MKTLTIKVSERLAAELESEAKTRGVSKSDVVRERLELASGREAPAGLAAIADLIGAVDEGPSDRSRRMKHYLRKLGYGGRRAG